MKKQSTGPVWPISFPRCLAGVCTVIILFWLGHKGYEAQQPAAAPVQMGMTPGAIAEFSEQPTVIPLSRVGAPVGVLKMNGQTFVIYSTPQQ